MAAKTNSGPEIPSLKIGVGTERIQKQLVDPKSCSHYSSHRSSSERLLELLEHVALLDTLTMCYAATT